MASHGPAMVRTQARPNAYLDPGRNDREAMATISDVLPAVPARELDQSMGEEPTRDELDRLVREYRDRGLCGRRVAEEYLVPFFVASNRHGQREIDLLEEVLEAVYRDSDQCVRTRSPSCKRWRGGCQNR